MEQRISEFRLSDWNLLEEKQASCAHTVPSENGITIFPALHLRLLTLGTKTPECVLFESESSMKTPRVETVPLSRIRLWEHTQTS